jgi:putative hydroxymethylpyrimidine transport system substrate-binding protein
MSALAIVALAAWGAVTATASNKSQKLTRVTLQLKWVTQAQFAGYYAAVQQGYYKAAGLDVSLTPPPDPAAPLKLLEAGRVDLAISYEPDVMLARDQGADVVAVGALVQKPLTALMSVGEKGVTRPQQLAGKTVGTAGIPYQSAYLKTILARAGVDPGSVKEVNVGFKLVQAMLAKKVDATIGAFWNVEGVQLQQAGRKPNIERIEDLGVPTYDELVFAARRKDLDQAGASRIRRFMQATARGFQLVRRDPAKGVDALLKANPDLERGQTAASVRATLPAFFPEDRERPWGWQDPAQWSAYEHWMRANDLLKPLVQGERAPLTNEFLPGEGLDQGTSGLG